MTWTLLTIATGLPGVADLPARRGHGFEDFAKKAHLIDACRDGDTNLLAPERRDRFHSTRTGAAGNAIVEVLYCPKLRLNRAAAKIAALGQHADDSHVTGEPAAGADLLFRVGVPVVEVEGQGRLRVRRNRYEHTLRGLAAREDETEAGFRPETGPELFGAGDGCRLRLRHRLGDRCGLLVLRSRPLSTGSRYVNPLSRERQRGRGGR